MRTIFILLLFIVLESAEAQLIDSTKYFVTEARINEENATELYFNNGQFLSFYNDEYHNPCFLNSKANREEYSYGKIYGYRKVDTLIDEYPAEVISFRWNYLNSYDDNTGYAFVQLKRIYRVNGVQFALKILSRELDLIVFNGFTNEMPMRVEDQIINDNNYNALSNLRL